MAAKQQGKKKTRDMKKKKPQKKPQKKLQKLKQKQKRSLPQKMKKGQPKPRAKAGTSKEENQICSPRLFAARILRQMPKVRMEGKARMLVKTMLTDMYNHVAAQVEATLSQKTEPLDISATDVQAALKEAMTKEMAKHVDEQPQPPAAPSECA
ncbi:uncharacterized protein [Anolis sagrei]|uniref:uncharacterized protein n=1 Tax=Anolis sagrei TaxID=38937 RepID=UPI003521A03E